MNRVTIKSAVLLALLANVPATSRGAVMETVQVTGAISDGGIGDPANTVELRILSGGYALGRVDVVGQLTAIQPLTWRTDSRIRITAPDNTVIDLQPFQSGTTFTTLAVNVSFFPILGQDPVGSWEFRFYEFLDDGGPGNADASWDLDFSFTDEAPVPPASTDLGAAEVGVVLSASAAVIDGVPIWFSFEVPCDVAEQAGTYLDIDTVGTDFSPGSGNIPNDTEIGLYDSDGNLVALDDDSGQGATSLLSFGLGGRPPVPPEGNGDARDGQTGPLSPGTYYLAVGPNNIVFESEFWSLQSLDPRNGSVTVTIESNVATPCQVLCPGDADGDHMVDFGDITAVLGNWLTDYTPGTGPGDADGNGIVNFGDITTVLGNWLSQCQ